jgi:hypothetical protein
VAAVAAVLPQYRAAGGLLLVVYSCVISRGAARVLQVTILPPP